MRTYEKQTNKIHVTVSDCYLWLRCQFKRGPSSTSTTLCCPPSTIKHMLCWVILLWVLLLAMKNVSTCAFNRCTFWMAWADTTHACTILGCCRVFFFFVSANRLTSSSGQIECARSDFCRETLFSHCSAMWLTSSSFCSQLFCVFNSVTS